MGSLLVPPRGRPNAGGCASTQTQCIAEVPESVMNLAATSRRAADSAGRLGPWPPGGGAARTTNARPEDQAGAWCPAVADAGEGGFSRRRAGLPAVGGRGRRRRVLVGGGTQTGPGGGVAEAACPCVRRPDRVPASEPGVRELIPPATGTREGKTGGADDPHVSGPASLAPGSPLASAWRRQVRAQTRRSPERRCRRAPRGASRTRRGGPGRLRASRRPSPHDHPRARCGDTDPSGAPTGRARRLAAAVARAGLDAALGRRAGQPSSPAGSGPGG